LRNRFVYGVANYRAKLAVDSIKTFNQNSRQREPMLIPLALSRRGLRGPRKFGFRSASSLFGNVCQLPLLDSIPGSQNEFLLTFHQKLISGETMRIFVGNLSYQTTEDQLADLFAEAGPVESVTIVTDRDTGRSRGFAFVEMDSEAANKAIEKFNGVELNGRAINVNEARPRPERNFGGGGRGGGGGGGYGGGRGQRREPRW
jgi:hypothetical protein